MHLVLQKLESDLYLCFVFKDRFQKGDNFEKINMEISGVSFWLNKTTSLAQILGSPADQCNLWKKWVVSTSR